MKRATAATVLSLFVLAGTATLSRGEQFTRERYLEGDAFGYFVSYRVPHHPQEYKTVRFTIPRSKLSAAKEKLQSIKRIKNSVAKQTEDELRQLQRTEERLIVEARKTLLSKIKRDAATLAARFPAGTTISVVPDGDTITLKGKLVLSSTTPVAQREQAKQAFSQSFQTLNQRVEHYNQASSQSINDYTKRSADSIISNHENRLKQRLKSSYLTLSERVISFDYRAAIEDSTASLDSLAHAFARDNVYDTHQLVTLVSYFFQAIPYRPIIESDRFTTGGVLLPELVIDQNIGDCDSKAIAVAAILRIREPELPIVFVLVPGHALLGVALGNQTPNGITVNYQNTAYTLLEIAGPGLFPPGSVAETTKTLLKMKETRVIKIP